MNSKFHPYQSADDRPGFHGSTIVRRLRSNLMAPDAKIIGKSKLKYNYCQENLQTSCFL